MSSTQDKRLKHARTELSSWLWFNWVELGRALLKFLALSWVGWWINENKGNLSKIRWN